ncbi:hypothetical protein ColLi_02122 [Colletotrichum liriopes]|uniref:Uncharacterized protein n=1 Tax=Colletotrichum liriopes TaxID=708192 RepID=A0AA37LNP8_9PEZI|nr:hypothetical protein ColLi_02122 [Colletotrichum liriopes]
MTSQEFQVLVAQARSEADNPAFRDENLVGEACRGTAWLGCLFERALRAFGFEDMEDFLDQSYDDDDDDDDVTAASTPEDPGWA